MPRTGIEPVLLADADFKSATSTNFVTRALRGRNIIADFESELFAETGFQRGFLTGPGVQPAD